jgi:hypothetical protein
MLLAGEWYTSEVFWAAVGGLATLVTGSVAAVIAHRVGTPKRRLAFGIYRTTRLLSEATGRVPELEVHHHGRVVAAPYLVEFHLVVSGRHDIPSSSYDAGMPMTFDMGVPILQVLEADTYPSTSPPPRMEAETTTLKVGPSLLKRRQKTTYTVLVDGTPDLSASVPLEGVDLLRLPTAREEEVDRDLAEIGGSLTRSFGPGTDALFHLALSTVRRRRRHR